MSVVPLVREGNNRTVVVRPTEFSYDGDAILIHGIDPRQLTGDTDSSNISYDLRIGAEFKDHRDTGKRELPENQTITLVPGGAVIVQTEEAIQLPKNRFACILPKVSLLQKGLSNTMSKVDPGYQGCLLVTLFNLGKQAQTVKRGDSFCSLCVFTVEGTAIPYGKQAKRIQGQAARRWWQTLRELLERNTGSLTALLLLFGLMSGIVQLVWMLIRQLLRQLGVVG